MSELSKAADPSLEVIAFYLPQFHQVPENDTWWGEGFTEWTNVKRARPYFPGHLQPQIPAGGYYSLNDPETLQQQYELAESHGITAFCMYAYWFGGRRLLEKPLEGILQRPALPVRYCLCWANESWTRAWDGGDNDILVEQHHNLSSDFRIIDDFAAHFRDERYVRVDGKPLFLVYRADLLDQPERTVSSFRERAEDLGVGPLHVAMVQSFDLRDPEPFGFDSAVEFPPHGSVVSPNIIDRGDPSYPELYDPAAWNGTLVDYRRTVEWALEKPLPGYAWYRTAMPGWDNTPRRGNRGTAWVGDDQAEFRRWLQEIIAQARTLHPDRPIIFLNSWNEWGESAQLEPDFDRGEQRLDAVAAAIRRSLPS